MKHLLLIVLFLICSATYSQVKNEEKTNSDKSSGYKNEAINYPSPSQINYITPKSLLKSKVKSNIKTATTSDIATEPKTNLKKTNVKILPAPSTLNHN